MSNPWLKPALAAVVICAVGAGGLRFLRGQQSHEPRAPQSPVEPPTVAALDVAAHDKPAPEPALPRLPRPVAETPPAPPPPVVAVPAGPAIIKGVAQLAGTPPPRALIKMDADPKCAAMHADEPPVAEQVVANADGTLRNVFVYVKRGLEGRTFPVPKTPVVLDQVGCKYVPRVLGKQARQPLLIRNSDDTLHNVHAMPTLSREFNIGQPNKGMESIRTFAAAEVMVKFKCDVHPWMTAYVGVLDHPFHAVTAAGGSFELKDLPPGAYTIAAWHETLGTQEQSVTIAAGETKTVSFRFTQ